MTKTLITASILHKPLSPNEIYCPMLTIHNTHHTLKETSYDTLIVTSSNGIINLKHRLECKNAIVIGNITANIVRNKLSLKNIIIFNCVMDILKYLNKINDAKCLYIRGKDISIDIVESVKHLNIDQIQTYTANPVKKIPENIKKMLDNGDIDQIKIYSYRGYQNFIKLIGNDNIRQNIIFNSEALRLKCQYNESNRYNNINLLSINHLSI